MRTLAEHIAGFALGGASVALVLWIVAGWSYGRYIAAGGVIVAIVAFFVWRAA